MPVYNGEKYLKEAIDSILGQTFTDFELLLINDGSIDESDSIIQSYNDKRIKYIKNKKNLGLIKTLNKGIKLAKGEYIARMDADDISLPKRFAKQVDFLDNNPYYGVIGSWVELIGSEKGIGKPLSNFYNLFYTFLKGGTMVPHPTVMLRRDVLLSNNIYYNEDYTLVEDFKLWQDLKYVTKITNLPDVLLKYRVHNESVSSVNAAKQTENKLKVMKEEFEKNFGEYKDYYSGIMLGDSYKITTKEFIEFLKQVEKYKERSYKLLLIKRFLRHNMNSKFDILSFMKMFDLSMVYYIFKG